MEHSSSRSGEQAAANHKLHTMTEAHTEHEQRFLKGVYAKAADLEKELAERLRVAEYEKKRRQSAWAFAGVLLGLLFLTAFVLIASDFSIGAVFGLSVLWMSAAAMHEHARLKPGSKWGLLGKMFRPAR